VGVWSSVGAGLWSEEGEWIKLKRKKKKKKKKKNNNNNNKKKKKKSRLGMFALHACQCLCIWREM
jgi:hypothetical protein